LVSNLDILILNLPSPPYVDIIRDYAGGFGTVCPTERGDYGQSAKPRLHGFLPYASAILSQEGIDYDTLDCQRLNLNKVQLLSNVKKRNPDIIFSLIGLPSLENDLELLNMLKDNLPNTLIVGVGTVCRPLHKEILFKSKVDVVLRNSYPNVSNMDKLVKTVSQGLDLKDVPGVSYVKDKKLVSTPESPDVCLSELLPPKYDSLQLEGYESSFSDKSGNIYSYISILVGKGCPYNCYYCPYPLGFGNKWTHKTPDAIADEIENLTSRGFEAFIFRDQSFPMNRSHATKVCNELIRRKLDIAWVCEARTDQVSKDILSLMKKSGCKRIHYGVETGDPNLMERAKPGIHLDTIRRAFRLTKELDLFTNAHMILGWPTESLQSLEKTRKFLLELDPDEINWNVLTPYPGTKIYEVALENNLILTHDWSKYTSHSVVMKTKNLSGNQLFAAKNRIIRDFTKRRMKNLLLNLPHRKNLPKQFIDEARNIIKSYITYNV
jgi:anaerobic magnesium-protoporphyrin IX monomethyl ester cyclase